LTGADADKFTLAGNKLTFIAKAFEAGSDNTYRVSSITLLSFSGVEKLEAVVI
jgi:hypothetical protein